MSCIAGTYDMVIDQGATLSRTLTWRDSKRDPYNITGYTARMHVRTTVTSTGIILVLTTQNGRIALGGAAGTVTLTVAAADTAVLAAGRYVYDLELVSSAGVVSRLVEGAFVVRPEVTR
jgi:hypothetical protein